jgi:uncharacterized protein (DUF305 family)
MADKRPFFIGTVMMKYIICFLLLLRFCFAQKMSMNNNVNMHDKNVFMEMMDTMMRKMDQVPETGSVESNFIQQMILHHMGAVEMAEYEIQHGKNFEIVQLAKSIKIEQENEIQLMYLWLRQSTDGKAVLPLGYIVSMRQSMKNMMLHIPTTTREMNIDREFSVVMIPHHQAAVNMARALIRYSTDQQTNMFAKNIISSQQMEIQQMVTATK